MNRSQIGELEELILLITASLYDDAYGVAIMNELANKANRKATISTVHAALKRLEEKGLVSSRYDGATPERGGRRKHLFTLTLDGQKALKESREIRNAIWNSIPKVAFGNG